MQFVVTALDYTDEGALQRRLDNREAHLAGIRELVAQGRILSGGAILNDDGKMIGSSMHVDFPDREALEKCLQRDPYVAGRVWEKFDIKRAMILPPQK